MSEQPEDKKLKRITIKTENGTKWFDDPDKLLAWVNHQQQLYSFHSQHSHRYQLQQLFNVFDQSWAKLQQQITQGLKRAQNDPDSYNNVAEQFSKSFNDYLEKQQLFTDEAPYSKFFQRQVKKGPEYGMAVLAVAFDANVSPLDREMYKAIQEADAFFAGNQERVTDEGESLQELRQRWDTEFTEQRDSWMSDYQFQIDEASRLNKKAESLIEDWQQQTETQSQELTDHQADFKKQYDDALVEASSELDNLTKTYDDKLALHASVKYWGLQHDSHESKAKGFAWALGITTVVVLATIIVFALYGLDKPIKEVAVSKLVTAAALTTFGLWAIKILANIFMSHLHLATDAQERRTMIHTYLALTRKGQGPKEEDRQLILQTLFRPSTTDMVKNDQGPTQLVDLINRLSPKQ